MQQERTSPTRRHVWRLTVCSVCGLEAPYQCEHMAAATGTPRQGRVYTSIEVVRLELVETIVEAWERNLMRHLDEDETLTPRGYREVGEAITAYKASLGK